MAKRATHGWRRCGDSGGVFGNRRSDGRSVGRRWSQQLPRAVEPGATGGTEDAVITNFGEAFGQDVLKEAVNELGGGKRDMTDLLSLVVTVAKTDDAVVERFQTAVGNGDAENVAGKIVEHLVAASSVLGMNDPADLPDGGRNESKETRLFQTGTELGAKISDRAGSGTRKRGCLGFTQETSSGARPPAVTSMLLPSEFQRVYLYIADWNKSVGL